MSYQIQVQINGKSVGNVELTNSYDNHKDDSSRIAEIPSIANKLRGKQLVKTIEVKGRLVNFIVKDNFVSPTEYAN